MSEPFLTEDEAIERGKATIEERLAAAGFEGAALSYTTSRYVGVSDPYFIVSADVTISDLDNKRTFSAFIREQNPDVT